MATPPKPPAHPPVQPAKAAPPPVPPQQAGPGIPPKPTPDPTTQTQTTFNIHGVVQGPQADMAPLPDEGDLNPGTLAEMEAGRKALKEYGGRTNAELEYGKKMVARKSGVTQSE